MQRNTEANQQLFDWYIHHTPDQRSAIRNRMSTVLKVSRQTVWNYIHSKTTLPGMTIELIEREFGSNIFSQEHKINTMYKITKNANCMKVEISGADRGCPLADKIEAAGIEVMQVIIHRMINQATIITATCEDGKLDEIIVRESTSL